jgi:transcriptional regulator with PAS, ATPase and Fis domain
MVACSFSKSRPEANVDYYKKYSEIRGPLLILGETGVGKTFWAKKIHAHSLYQKQKFIHIDLPSLSSHVFESELFGHERGAFTGAEVKKRGFLDEVNGGTLFLDEIGDLDLNLQRKLLFFLEEKKYYSVGSTTPKEFSGRVIFATNRNLEEMVAMKIFRQDLYYRLLQYRLDLPALRTLDLSDLEALIESFLTHYANLYQRRKLTMDSCLREFLLAYTWPGNVREMRNCLEAMISFKDENSGVLTLQDLPAWVVKEKPRPVLQKICLPPDFPKWGSVSEIWDYKTSVEEFERNYFREVLTLNHGRVTDTAKKINISKVTLIAKARKYGINTLQLRVSQSS